MVSNTRELLPEPETPVNTVSRRLGISMEMSLRLFTLAPWTRIRSCWSATCSAGAGVSARVAVLPVSSAAIAGRSAQLLDADQVASGIADGGVANAVRLLRRLLDDL